MLRFTGYEKTHQNHPPSASHWPDYNAALKQRGSLSVWIDEAVTKGWCAEAKLAQHGGPVIHSDLAIATITTLGNVFGQTECGQGSGLAESLLSLMGLNLAIPDHNTLARRLGGVKVELPVKAVVERARHVVIDHTGIKVFGAGEWWIRQQKVSQRRTWRKLHVGFDEATGEIIISVVRTNDFKDC